MLGVLIGLTLGALGGGGSILTVPALVYVLGEGVQNATTGSLVIVGITAAVATVGRARAGQVRWGSGLAFGAAGIVASLAGTALNTKVDPNVLLICFAAFMLIAVAAMLTKTSAHSDVAVTAAGPLQGPRAHTGGTLTTLRQHQARQAARWTLGTTTKVVCAGALVGFLTGFLGVGGGFVIVPALVLVLAYEMPLAIGTSLLIISLNSGVALLARSGYRHVHWAVIAPFTIAAIAGSVAGKRIGDRVSGGGLTRAFAVLLLLVASYVLIRSGFLLS